MKLTYKTNLIMAGITALIFICCFGLAYLGVATVDFFIELFFNIATAIAIIWLLLKSGIVGDAVRDE